MDFFLVQVLCQETNLINDVNYIVCQYVDPQDYDTCTILKYTVEQISYYGRRMEDKLDQLYTQIKNERGANSGSLKTF